MRVLFLIPHLHLAASNRYRVYQYLPYLHAQGIETSLKPFVDTEAFYHLLYQPGNWINKAAFTLGSTLKRLGDLKSIEAYDLVFIQREALPFGGAWLESWVASRNFPIIFDFDDAVFLPNVSRANRRFSWLKQPQKTSRIVQVSSHIIAGNQYLADYAAQYNPRITVIPTPIDTERYTPHPKLSKQMAGITIGWVGGHTTIGFLEDLKPVFQQLAKRYQIRIFIVGGDFSIPEVVVDERPWRLENEISDLHQIDIGVMPMPDTPWTRGKCGFKALQYMGVGVPTVASPVGVNTEIITHGQNGFLASSNEQWLEYLSRLIENPGLRKEIGMAGWQTVQDRYSLKLHAPRLLEVIQSVQASGSRGYP